MSWASHDLEPYVLQRHLGVKIAFLPLMIGSYAPDLATKWLVYGTTIFGIEFSGGADPSQFHRGWPGVGFTHSLFFGVLIGLLLWRFLGALWGVSFAVGCWLHVLTDMFDTVGCMLFFPFTTHQFSVGMWAYTVTKDGRLSDAAAYFSGPGILWDGFWLLLAVFSWQALRAEYFRSTIVPTDPFWGWAARRVPEAALIALYRASFFYGGARLIAWLIWAHVLNDYPFDLTWGGPHWAPAVR